MKIPSSAIACIDSGSAGSTRLIASSIASRLTVMPFAYVSTAFSTWARSHGTCEKSRLVGGFAQGHVQPDLVFRDFEAFAVRLDVGRDERGRARRSQREADVAGGEHLGGEVAQGLAELPAEEGAAERGHHRLHRAELGFRLVGDQVAHGADHASRDRVAQLLPGCRACCRSTRCGSRIAGALDARRAARRPGPATGRRGAGTPRRCGVRRRSPAGSPAVVSWLAATWRARSQLTGPLPGAANICCSCAMNCCICCGSEGSGGWAPGREKPNGISGTSPTVRAKTQYGGDGGVSSE